MGELLKFPDNDKYFYVEDDNKIVGVCSDDLCLSDEGSQIYITTRDQLIEKWDLKELMIMWLALNYPDVLKYDEEGE